MQELTYIVTAKRYPGDQIKFSITSTDPKEAYEAAKKEANRIFSYKDGEVNPPIVSLSPVAPEE